MATRRSRTYRLDLDNRTESMPTEALLCRSMNHPWQFIPPTLARRNELLEMRQAEFTWICIRCHSRRVDLLEFPTFAVVRSRVEYSADYLIKDKGTGRLPRPEARKAMFMREIPAALVN